MKIVFTCNRLGLGGAERVICNFANRMIKDEHDVSIVCLDVLDGFHYYIDENVKVIQLDEQYKTRKAFLDRKLAGMNNFKKLMNALKSEKPDIVVSFYTRQNCYSILACSLLQIPIIAAERDHFFTCDSKINQLLRKVFYPKATGFIHQTNWARNYLRENCGIKCSDIVLPNPIWIKEYPQRNAISKKIISVGRLEEQKNYRGLIRAFKKVKEKVPEASFTIYGEGVQRRELEELIEELNLSGSVFLPGNTNKVLECYAQADLFVLFSHGEGYPNALMEALAVGVPCVSSDCFVGGPADMIADGHNGILVPAEDEEELSNNIIKIITDEDGKKLFSKNAINIRETNSFDKIYSDLMAYIDKCLLV